MIVTNYNRFLGYLFIALSLISLGIFILGEMMHVNVNFTHYIPLLICFIFGWMYLVKPYFKISDTEILIIPLIGPFKKKIPHGGYQNICIDGNNLYLYKEGKRFRVKVKKWMARPSDWNKLVKYLQDEDLTKELHDI